MVAKPKERFIKPGDRQRTRSLLGEVHDTGMETLNK